MTKTTVITETCPIYFALIMDRRSGSTLLRDTLNQHPQIDCSGEIFNSFAGLDGIPGSHERGYGATMEVFWNWRRAERASDTKAIGTLIHRWQTEFFPGLMELTRGLHTRFICVYRDNLVRQFLSELIAMNTATWSSDPKFVENLPKMTMDPDALSTYIHTRYRERVHDWHFQPRIEYSLEHLIEDWDKVMERIQLYLGLKPEPLEPTSQRQETRRLEDAIANYGAVEHLVLQLGHPEWLDPPQRGT